LPPRLDLCASIATSPSARLAWRRQLDGAVLTARAAGVPVALVRGGYTAMPAEELGADALVGGFAALPAALEALLPAA